MVLKYPWFGLITDDSIEQGDFLFSCDVIEQKLIPPAEPGDKIQLKTNASVYDVVILSQSCDLVQGKLETVLVCPHWTLDEITNNKPDFKDKNNREDIRRGNMVGYHMLATCDLPGFNSEIRVVSFRQVFGLPLSYIQDFTKQQNSRLRLLPPYREHLAQSFARFIMRVGLPVDIPPFT